MATVETPVAPFASLENAPDGAPRCAVGIEIHGPEVPGSNAVLTPEALRFLEAIVRAFGTEREGLLARRREIQADLDRGARPDFPRETESIRGGDWRVPPPPPDLLDRRVEITGPVDRKMIINASNSGANAFMADFEDSNSPTWENVVRGQINLRDAVRGTIEYVAPDTGKIYRLNPRTATLMVRPRGWHLLEEHARLDGRPVPAALFDFALFVFHNAESLRAKGSGPYFYLPKLENRLEARLWNSVFRFAEGELRLPIGTIRATVLIETILAAFEMDEILWELRERAAGLNCGRWDYIFSVIKKFRSRPEFLFPDRGRVTMDRPFLRAYADLVIRTCHRRGAHAIGGMAAQIPIKNDPDANRIALESVVADKRREVAAGHDGTWVAHPGLVATARAVFDGGMTGPNQISRSLSNAVVRASDLLEVPRDEVTEAGVRRNVSVGIRYLEAWLGGSGCVPLDNLMEDAATAEISRAQLWQWVHHGARLSDGRAVDLLLYERVRDEELAAIRGQAGEERWSSGRYELAASLFDRWTRSDELEDFLTIPAYRELLKLESNRT